MNVLAFFAHPDDETMMAGGMLALLARGGADVHYLCATRGEGGETGEPPLCSPEELGRVRAAEMACTVDVLGGRSLAFLDYVDPLIGPDDQLYAYTDDLDGLAVKLQTAIRRVGADALITHGSSGEYGHPGHIACYQGARRAITALGERAPAFYCVSAEFPGHPKPRHINHGQPAHLVLDVTPALEQKVQAALCHRSQNALFVRRASKRAGRPVSVPEVILHIESLHRVWPPVEGGLEDGVAEILRPWGV